MAKPPLSMQPTGWSQIAWSAEVGIGDVRRMKYFDREMIAWRSASGRVAVMDAYCEHLGAHPGYSGRVEARPGVITSADLPLRACAGRFR